jgi:hypothetical protein
VKIAALSILVVVSAATLIHAAEHVIGPIQSIDVVANVIEVVDSHSGELLTVSMDANTEFVCHGQTLTMADFGAGEDVQVTYTLIDGKPVADKVACHGPQ